MKSGQRSYIPGIGYIHITNVESVQLENLTDDDAVPDGFATADLLRREITKIYGKKSVQNLLPYRVCFEVYPPDIQMQMQTEQKIRKQQAGNQSRHKQVIEDALTKLQRIVG